MTYAPFQSSLPSQLFPFFSSQLKHSFHRWLSWSSSRSRPLSHTFTQSYCFLACVTALRWLSVGLLLAFCLSLEPHVSWGKVLCPFCSLLYPQCLCCIRDLAGGRRSLHTWRMNGSQERLRVERSGLLEFKSVFKFTAATDKDCGYVFQPIFWGLLNLSVPWSLTWLISDCSGRNLNQWAESSMAGITPDTFHCYSCWQLTLGVSQDNLGAFKIQILLLHLYMNRYIPWIRTPGVERKRASVWYSISLGDSHCWLLSGYSQSISNILNLYLGSSWHTYLSDREKDQGFKGKEKFFFLAQKHGLSFFLLVSSISVLFLVVIVESFLRDRWRNQAMVDLGLSHV